MKQNSEYILCSAIWYKDLSNMELLPINCDKGIVLCGYRHVNIIMQMLSTMGLRTVRSGKNAVGKFKQGFLTSQNRFVDRIEAAKIALEAGQIEKPVKTLFSEDLY